MLTFVIMLFMIYLFNFCQEYQGLYLPTDIVFMILHQSNVLILSRNSRQMCSVRKGILRNFTKFTGKHLCQSIFLNKVAGVRPATLLKKRLWHRCFPVSFAKFVRTLFLQDNSGGLLPAIFYCRYEPQPLKYIRQLRQKCLMNSFVMKTLLSC